MRQIESIPKLFSRTWHHFLPHGESPSKAQSGLCPPLTTAPRQGRAYELRRKTHLGHHCFVTGIHCFLMGSKNRTVRADVMQRLLTEKENSELGSEIRVSCRGEGRRASTSKGWDGPSRVPPNHLILYTCCVLEVRTSPFVAGSFTVRLRLALGWPECVP